MAKKVLIIDDSALARRFIRQCVQITFGNELEFLEASNGKDGLAVLGTNPDAWLVLTDLNMPLMDGFEFVRHLRSSGFSKTNVVVVSSLQNAAREKELLQEGAIAVMSKPISPQKLKEQVEPLLKQKGAL
jgi:two-component system chemotaxis response regulator CheY